MSSLSIMYCMEYRDNRGRRNSVMAQRHKSDWFPVATYYLNKYHHSGQNLKDGAFSRIMLHTVAQCHSAPKNIHFFSVRVVDHY